MGLQTIYIPHAIYQTIYVSGFKTYIAVDAGQFRGIPLLCFLKIFSASKYYPCFSSERNPDCATTPQNALPLHATILAAAIDAAAKDSEFLWFLGYPMYSDVLGKLFPKSSVTETLLPVE